MIKSLLVLLIFIIGLVIIFSIALKKQNPVDRFDIGIFSYIIGILVMGITIFIG